MKYVVSLLLGLAVGVAAFVALLYFNPLTSQNRLSPLSDHEVITLNYSAVPADALVYTNDGESPVAPNPVKVLQLWEPPIRRTDAMATLLRDSRNQLAGIGIKFSSDSENTRILNGEVLVDSVWHIYLPGQGSMFVDQTENHWSLLRDIVIPAHWSSGDNWRGTWNGSITSGPGALGTARVTGGSGVFEGLRSEAVESLMAEAYSVDRGPVAIDGVLAVEIPRVETAATPDP